MKCSICGNSEGNRPYHVLEMNLGTREPFDYFQCSRCACLQIARIPEDLARYYPTEYISMAFDERKYSGIKGSFRDLLCRSLMFPDTLARKLISFLIHPHKNLVSLKGLGITRETRLLDVGCGTGAAGAAWRARRRNLAPKN
jgi:hypothetical protein